MNFEQVCWLHTALYALHAANQIPDNAPISAADPQDDALVARIQLVRSHEANRVSGYTPYRGLCPPPARTFSIPRYQTTVCLGGVSVLRHSKDECGRCGTIRG